MRVRVPFHRRGSNCVRGSLHLSPSRPHLTHNEKERRERQRHNFPSEADSGPAVSQSVRRKTRRSSPRVLLGAGVWLLRAPRSDSHLYLTSVSHPGCETDPRIQQGSAVLTPRSPFRWLTPDAGRNRRQS